MTCLLSIQRLQKRELINATHVNTRSNLEDGEKEYLRSQLLQLILEEDNQVSLSLICYVCYLPSWQQVHSHINQALEFIAVQNQNIMALVA